MTNDDLRSLDRRARAGAKALRAAIAEAEVPEPPIGDDRTRAVPRWSLVAAGIMAIAVAGTLLATRHHDDETVKTGPVASVPDKEYATVAAPDLLGEFRLRSGLSGVTPSERTFIRFEASGQLRTSGGCNTAHSSWAVKDDVLVVDDWRTTSMACPGGAESADAAIAALVGSRPSIELDGNILVLRTDEHTASFERTDPLSPLAGDWYAVGFSEAVTLELWDDRYVLDVGCAEYRGEVAVIDDWLSYRSTAATTRPCSSADTSLEDLQRFVSGPIHWTATTSTLRLETSTGDQLDLQRVDGSRGLFDRARMVGIDRFIVRAVHPTLGLVRVEVAAIDSARDIEGPLIRVTSHGGADDVYEWRNTVVDSVRPGDGAAMTLAVTPVPSPVDAIGHLHFQVTSSGGTFAAVLVPTDGGYDDLGSLPPEGQADARFAPESFATDIDGDAIYEILVSDCRTTCDPQDRQELFWDGADYTPRR